MTRVLRIVGAIFAIETLIPAVYLILVFGGNLLNISTYVIESGSMEPAIPIGSLVYVDRDFDEYEMTPNDVVAFEINGANTQVCTHRIVANDIDSQSIRTKGDSNKEVDPIPIPYDNIIGRVVLSIPYLGFLVCAVSVNKAIAFCGYICILVITFALYCFIRKRTTNTFRKEGSGTYGIKCFNKKSC